MADLCFSTLCPNPEGLGEEFYSKGSRMGLPIRIRVCAGSRWSGLLILMRLSCPFNLDSGGFLAALLLISNCFALWRGFPVVKTPPASAGDASSIPGLELIPWRRT